jgi:hypothetical protein
MPHQQQDRLAPSVAIIKNVYPVCETNNPAVAGGVIRLS